LVLQHLERTPTDAVVRLTYVRHLIGQEHLQAALPHLQTLTAAASASAESWLLQGLVEHQLNRYPAAETSLKQFLSVVDAQPPAQAVSPRGVVQALLMLSQMAELRGDVTQAQAWLDRITDGDDVLRVQARRASLLLKKGQFEEGLALIAAVPERQGSDARAKLLTQVQLLRDHKAWGRAYALLDQENTRQSDDVDLLYEQAMMADKMSRFEDMERLLRRTLAFKPDYHHALNALGYALADRNERLPEAKALIEQALSLAPGDPFITDSLGWVEFRLGHLAQAEHLLRQAFDKRADAEIALHLAEVLWTQGKRDEAKALFRQAHEMQPDHAQLQPTLQRLGVQW
jgi:Flp pilus assembly protein TadD